MTVAFIKKMSKKAGFSLHGRDDFRGTVNWITNNSMGSDMLLARDVVLMYKFLITMETREKELTKKKKRKEEAPMWSIEFEDENTGHVKNNVFRAKIKWKIGRYRGNQSHPNRFPFSDSTASPHLRFVPNLQ